MDVNGQIVFPLLAEGGGLLCATMIYFGAGELDADLGRGGPVKHKAGYSWGVKSPGLEELTPDQFRAELKKFADYLDEQGFK